MTNISRRHLHHIDSWQHHGNKNNHHQSSSQSSHRASAKALHKLAKMQQTPRLRIAHPCCRAPRNSLQHRVSLLQDQSHLLSKVARRRHALLSPMPYDLHVREKTSRKRVLPPMTRTENKCFSPPKQARQFIHPSSTNASTITPPPRRQSFHPRPSAAELNPQAPSDRHLRRPQVLRHHSHAL